MTTDYLNDIFGPEGVLAGAFEGYELREGQLNMARFVDAGIREKKHVAVEGPTGVGKGMAYCVPAIYWADAGKQSKTTLLVTANIALQEQLFTKDLPQLKELLPVDFQFAMLKGMNNYYCPSKAMEARLTGLSKAGTRKMREQMTEILAWAKKSPTGDRSELSFEPMPEVWSKVSITPDECDHGDCPMLNECPYYAAKRKAQAADIVVTNYHLLFAHLSVRMVNPEAEVVPAHDVLVLDESHEAAEIAREFFGFTLAQYGFRRMINYAKRRGAVGRADELKSTAALFFEELRAYMQSGRYSVRLRQPDFADCSHVVKALAAVEELCADIAGDEGEEDRERRRARTIARQAYNAGKHLQETVSLSDSNKVYWLELSKRKSVIVKAKLINVSRSLRSEMFDKTSTVVMTSATLTTGGNFGFMRKETGLPETCYEYVAPSPFDFQRQGQLLIPDGLPMPFEQHFTDHVAGAVHHLSQLCEGRTLVLFTSYRNMKEVAERMRQTSDLNILVQGDAPRTRLVERFKTEPRSVLLGVASFWTGVDVQGDALVSLIVDKLPFPNPKDPLVDAIGARDSNSFWNYSVPRAIILLRQGVGRMIRAKTDYGVVTLLDRRLIDKGYGRRFLASLPKFPQVRHIPTVEAFLKERLP